MRYVDIGIPSNNKGRNSIGCLFWLLARMVLQMRGSLHPGQKWDIMVDLFFYREPEDPKEANKEDEAAPQIADYGVTDYTTGARDPEPYATFTDAQFLSDGATPIPAVPSADWAQGNEMAAPVGLVAEGGWDEVAAPPPAAAAAASGFAAAAPPAAAGWD